MVSELDIAHAEVCHFAPGSSAEILSFCARAITRANLHYASSSAARAVPIVRLQDERHHWDLVPKRALGADSASASVLDVSGATPLAALALLKANMPTDRVAWRKKARVAAVLGSCPRSQSSYKSGVKHWVEFIKITHGVNAADSVAFPLRLEDVLAWSNTFRYVLL